MIMNPIAREIVIDGDDCVHTASPFFLPHSSHATYFSIFNRLEVDEFYKFLKYQKLMDIEMALKNTCLLNRLSPY
jgi:hypothetical protein